MINEDDLLKLKPLKDYKAPELPTYKDDKPDLEKKTPLRWKSKAMIAVVSGLLGVTTLTGCSRHWPHYGGAGGAPMYTVYLTEQEALKIIRTQLEHAGLNLDANPPNETMTYGEGWSEREIGIDLFDEENNVGVTVIDNWWGNSQNERAVGIRDALVSYFAEEGIHIGVIFNQQNETWDISEIEHMEENIEEYLLQQVQGFIQQLREEGIID